MGSPLARHIWGTIEGSMQRVLKTALAARKKAWFYFRRVLMLPKLHVVICSTRPGRAGPSVARWFHDYAAQHGKFDVELVDLADFKLPLYDEPLHPAQQKYTHEHQKVASVAAADAYIFVTPSNTITARRPWSTRWTTCTASGTTSPAASRQLWRRLGRLARRAGCQAAGHHLEADADDGRGDGAYGGQPDR